MSEVKYGMKRMPYLFSSVKQFRNGHGRLLTAVLAVRERVAGSWSSACPVITCCGRLHANTLDPIIPFAFAPPPSNSIKMVRSTIVVRASDALPLAASVDDEQVGCHS
jgi:hypothetical protein